MTQLDADWLTEPGVRAVCRALSGAGFRVLFVGGCVRNTLLGRPVSDIDLATNARPEAVMAAVEAAGLKAVPTGIAHGTVTVVADGVGFEVTTFRRDVETDGRHAVVRFSDRMEDDAARRDFTMNALYATPEGEVLDPIGGLPDLRAGRLRFIGDANQRIAEDYLRILRFFRFHAWYADPAGGLDGEAMAACAAGGVGLARLPAERIWHELRRLLAAPDPAPAVAAMAQSGILARVLPGAEARALPVLVHLEAGAPPDPIRRLAALGGPMPDLHLSRDDARHLGVLRDGVSDSAPAALLAYRLGAGAARDIVWLRTAMIGWDLPEALESALARGAEARFPVAAADLMPGLQGAALGQRLRDLEARWLASDFTLSREDLLGSE